MLLYRLQVAYIVWLYAFLHKKYTGSPETERGVMKLSPVHSCGKTSRCRTKILGLFTFSLLMVLVLCSCGYTSKESCVYCGSTPTKAFETATGEDCYVCRSCATTCRWCGDKATKHYTNLLGNEVFVCASCYDEIHDRS